MSSDEKTLVILTPGFAANESDTTCLPMQQTFIRQLNEKYPKLKIIILAFQYPYFKKGYTWFGNTVISFDGRNRGGLFKLLLRQKLSQTLKKIHRAGKISGLLSFWYGECAWVGKKFADKYDINHYCWMWGQDAKKENRYPGRLKLKAGELIAFSDFLQKEFEKNHDTRPLHVITPGVDIKEFPSGNIEKDTDIAAAGSLIPLKQYDVFIEAVAQIKKDVPSIKAVLVGDGPERKNLQTQVASSGLQSNITLTGELAHPELIRWMQRAKVFLHTSSYEGFGIVCLEALCSGAEVISFVKPMNQQIENWHIVSSKEEMIQKAKEVLKKPNHDHKCVVPYPIEQSVKKMAQLFSF